jgi:hypothetical protein
VSSLEDDIHTGRIMREIGDATQYHSHPYTFLTCALLLALLKSMQFDT